MIYTIAHPKGGVGKSTLVWHIICYLKQLGINFVLIDLDHQRTIHNTNRSIRKIEKLTVETASNIHQLNQLLKTHEDKLIIIDTGGYENDLLSYVLSKSDKIITPIGCDSTFEMIGFKKFVAILKKINNPKINIVFSKIYHSVSDFKDISEVVHQYPSTNIIKTIIRDRANYKHSANIGLGITEVKKTKNKIQNINLKKSTNEIKALVEELEIYHE